MNTGEKIKKYRQESKYNQTDFAKKLGITMNTLSNYERGITQPTTEMLLKISNELGINIDDLVSEYDVSLKDLNDSIDHLLSILINKTKEDKIKWNYYLDTLVNYNVFEFREEKSIDRIFKTFDFIHKQNFYYTTLYGTDYCIFIFSSGADKTNYHTVITRLIFEDYKITGDIDIMYYQSEKTPKLIEVIKSKRDYDKRLLKEVIEILK